MSHVSHKLRTPLQGALAGGGDPATSPLYVFGPFLRLIVAAGVAEVTFGASVWLVIFTIAVVSAMYRLVMRWIVDGSGGSGLSEEEFGAWAVKVNAGITFVEYTLTFLVSIAALVTFVADRFQRLNQTDFLLENRTWLAIVVSFATGWLVNRGPRTTARTFGPATGGVLILLWVMMVATVMRSGLQLPTVNLDAFTPEFAGDTIAGYARILAVMTGIEIFANMVAAYDGPPERRSRNAFRGLLIIMGTTGLTMLIVGPAIFEFADPFDEEVSVFTQTMDELLPGPVAALGTIVSVAVLLSAAAASAFGLQNLFVGLRLRHYVPPTLGRLNRFGVADRPVWIEVGIAMFTFVVFGTSEETYLALYAAGVFVLLAMTGWAATKRLVRESRAQRSAQTLLVLTGTFVAAVLTSGATLVIFTERFTEGAWTYLLFIPGLYLAFSYFRRELGPPTRAEQRAGSAVSGGILGTAEATLWEYEADRPMRRILVPHDGTDTAHGAVPVAREFAASVGADVELVAVGDGIDLGDVAQKDMEAPIHVVPSDASVAAAVCRFAHDRDVDLIVMSTRGRTGLRGALLSSVAAEVIEQALRPVLVVSPNAAGVGEVLASGRIVVALDGSREAERALSYVRVLTERLACGVSLAHVPAGPDRSHEMQSYLEEVAAELEEVGVATDTFIGGHDPGKSIPAFAHESSARFVLAATHGRSRSRRLAVGSIALEMARTSAIPVMLVPIIERRAGGGEGLD